MKGYMTKVKTITYTPEVHSTTFIEKEIGDMITNGYKLIRADNSGASIIYLFTKEVCTPTEIDRLMDMLP